MAKADKTGACDLLDKWGAEHGYDKILSEVLEPLLKELGEQWVKNEFSLSQAYVAAKVAEDMMMKIASEKGATNLDTAQKGPVVMGNIEDDYHALGRRMVITFLRTDGWIVHDLGNDVTPEEFVDKALEVGAKVIGASAMMHTTAENIKTLRTEIDRRNVAGKIQLAVGGAVFVLRPELVEEVGGDGTARNALVASSCFSELIKKACNYEEHS